MRLRVLQTTDGKYQGQVFTLPPGPPTVEGASAATGGRFNPTRLIIESSGRIRLVNSHYTAICEVV